MEQSKQNIVILTGAGISKESGLATFRDEDGIWSKVRIEDVATPEAFRRDPEKVQGFYNARRRPLLSGNIKPNGAHDALARLEKEWPDKAGGQVTIVTQNIDNLHETAGSENLIHMHGEILKARCGACGAVSPCQDNLGNGESCADCGEVNRLRPHVVWFGEMPFEMGRIDAALTTCDLFLSIGTSGNVYPAAGYVAQIREMGRARSVELNLEPSEGATMFDDCINGPATEIVPAFVDQILT